MRSGCNNRVTAVATLQFEAYCKLSDLVSFVVGVYFSHIIMYHIAVLSHVLFLFCSKPSIIRISNSVSKTKTGIHNLAGSENNIGIALSEARMLQSIYEAGCTRGMENIYC